jgi:hypothetical protein
MIACALGHKASRDNRSVHHLPRLFVLDDWGLAPLTGKQRRDLLEAEEGRRNNEPEFARRWQRRPARS